MNPPVYSPQLCFLLFLVDPNWGHYKMKWPLGNCPNTPLPFAHPQALIEKVPIAEFRSYEPLRLPLFLGASHAGIYPRYGILEPIPDGHLHFILSKSMLSGHVKGLKLNRWKAGKGFETLMQW